MSTLIVELPSAPGQELAYALTPDGHALAGQGRAVASLLPQASDLVAVVPWRLLSWQRLRMPKVAAARLRAALEGLLEEQVLDEPAQLHLAVEPGAQPGDEAWVAVCDRAWLKASVQALEQAGRAVQRIVPAWYPSSAEAPLVCGTPDDAWVLGVRAADETGAGMALPLAWAASRLASPGDAAARPLVRAEPAVAAQAEQALNARVEVRPQAAQLISSARTDWNLAQFDLVTMGGARLGARLARALRAFLSAREWRLARAGAVALVAIQLLGLNAWAWKQRSELDQRRSLVTGLLQQTFPQVKLVIDAPVQMERELAALRQASGANSAKDLESLLGDIATVVPPAQQPVGIEFSPGELRLRGLNLDSAQLQEAARRLSAHSLRMEGADLVVRAAPPATGGSR